ncbi:MBL fold metallo-hydrolase [Cerasibacillus terrae]|uniref:MBL fold metallo-hydrolase n=2 Tax=Cerasibacillus terrae TaxID=2498845 RepID=A0A5C8NXA3_9BACI|nr:MBL fold metallo-hydrolase [Cerasibacillus terrae]
MMRRFYFSLFCCFILWMGSAIHIGEAEQKKFPLKVHFIDVGQGDSIFIQTPNRKTILIDGGPPEAGKTVIHYLQKQGVTEIDLIIATHPDIDHIGGLLHVLEKIPVKFIVDSGKFHATKTYFQYVTQIREQMIPVQVAKEKEKISIDPLLDIKVLNTTGKIKTNNQSSIVLHIKYDDSELLLTGDIDRFQEKRIRKKYNIKSDILKVAHHGSKTSSTMSFLKEVDPQITILTYDIGNDFGHPHKKVIQNLNKIDTTIYSTAVYGNIILYTEGSEYMIDIEKSPVEALQEKTN